MTQETLDKLRECFDKVFKRVEFDQSLSMENTRKWNSLRHVQFLGLLEKQFDVEFTGEQVGKLTSIEAIMAFLAEK